LLQASQLQADESALTGESLPVDLRPNIISVRPTTQEQRDRSSQALQTVRQQIEKLIAAQSDRAQTLITEENCDTYKLEIENIIRQIESVSSLPEHLVTSLRDALRVADQTKAKIQEQAKIGECLSEIHRLYNNLNENSSQEDYTRTRAEITTLAQRIPDRADEAGEVRQVLQDIEQRYQELNQKIGHCIIAGCFRIKEKIFAWRDRCSKKC
jgi:predicted glycosyltransferase